MHHSVRRELSGLDFEIPPRKIKPNVRTHLRFHTYYDLLSMQGKKLALFLCRLICVNGWNTDLLTLLHAQRIVLINVRRHLI